MIHSFPRSKVFPKAVVKRTVVVTFIAVAAAIAISVTARTLLGEPLQPVNFLVMILGTSVIAAPLAWCMFSQSYLLAKAREQLVELNDRLEYECSHDQLTGLSNRRALHDLMEAQRGGGFDLVLLDLDHFKSINDQHGHPIGDKALRLVGKTITANLNEGGTAARIGGEEFAVVAPRGQGRKIAERIRCSIEQMPLIAGNGGLLRFTISAGCLEHADESGPSEAMRKADEALYEAKAGGRNRIVMFRPKLAEAL